MSAGPIAQERAAHLPPKVSTTDTARVCAPGAPGRGYCGRRTSKPADWPDTTCTDCQAARRADQAAGEAPRWTR